MTNADKPTNPEVIAPLIDAMLEMAPQTGLSNLSVARLARHCGISPAQGYQSAASIGAVVAAYQERLTQQMLTATAASSANLSAGEAEEDAEEEADVSAASPAADAIAAADDHGSHVADTLTALLMERFEAMEHHRPFWQMFFRGNGVPRAASTLLYPSGKRAMLIALDYATTHGCPRPMPLGMVKKSVAAAALWCVFMRTAPQWLQSSDEEKILAVLDGRIRRCCELSRAIKKPRRLVPIAADVIQGCGRKMLAAGCQFMPVPARPWRASD